MTLKHNLSTIEDVVRCNMDYKRILMEIKMAKGELEQLKQEIAKGHYPLHRANEIILIDEVLGVPK